jgi:PEP-CTERM motif
MAVAANAASITYTTNAAGTAFVSGNFSVGNPLVMNSTGGQAATLTFTPNPVSTTGVPSGIDLGDFLLSCPTCSDAQTTTFGGFTFDLVVTDQTDVATGEFVGTSIGAVVSANSSTLEIDWALPSLGPGPVNALTGNFGPTIFTRLSPIVIVPAPNSGSPPGDVTIQGLVSSTPEPATFGLIGGALIGLGFWRRKRLLRG